MKPDTCQRCGAVVSRDATWCRRCGRSASPLSSTELSAAALTTRSSVDAEAGQGRKGGSWSPSHILLAIFGLQVVAFGAIVVVSDYGRQEGSWATLAVTGGFALVFFALWLWARADPLPAAVTGLIVYATGVALDLVVLANEAGRHLVRNPRAYVFKAFLIAALVNSIVSASRQRRAALGAREGADHTDPDWSGRSVLTREGRRAAGPMAGTFGLVLFPLLLALTVAAQGFRTVAMVRDLGMASRALSVVDGLLLAVSVVVVLVGLRRVGEEASSSYWARSLLGVGLSWGLVVVGRLAHLVALSRAGLDGTPLLRLAGMLGLDVLIVISLLGCSGYWRRVARRLERRREQTDGAFEEASALLEVDPEAARALLEVVLTAEPGIRDARELLARSLLAGGRLEEGTRCLYSLAELELVDGSLLAAHRRLQELQAQTRTAGPPAFRWRLALKCAFAQPQLAHELLTGLVADPDAPEHAELARQRLQRVPTEPRAGQPTRRPVPSGEPTRAGRPERAGLDLHLVTAGTILEDGLQARSNGDSYMIPFSEVRALAAGSFLERGELCFVVDLLRSAPHSGEVRVDRISSPSSAVDAIVGRPGVPARDAFSMLLVRLAIRVPGPLHPAGTLPEEGRFVLFRDLEDYERAVLFERLPDLHADR